MILPISISKYPCAPNEIMRHDESERSVFPQGGELFYLSVAFTFPPAYLSLKRNLQAS